MRGRRPAAGGVPLAPGARTAAELSERYEEVHVCADNQEVVDRSEVVIVVVRLFQGAGRSLSDETRPLHQLAADHETPNGNNERVRTTWFNSTNSEALNQALDDLLAELK